MKKVDTIEMERAESSAGRGRRKRRHSDEFKAQVVAACDARGASVSGVAMAHGVNANLVRKWIIKQRSAAAPVAATSLLPVRIMTATAIRAAAARNGNAMPLGEVIEIGLAGAVIRVSPGFDTGSLSDVVQVLRGTLPR